MFISINGVVMPILTVEEWFKKNVFSANGLEYLYEYNKITLITHANPDNIFLPPVGTTLVGGGNPNNPNNAYIKPANLSQLISGTKEFLGIVDAIKIPRRKMFVWLNDDAENPTKRNFIFESPNVFGAVCDAINGPLVQNVQLINLGGQSTIALRIQIETAVAPTFDLSQKPKDKWPILISNTWNYSISHSDRYFVMRIITGEAVFRMDLFRMSGLTVDFFAKELFFPIPAGFKRLPPKLSLSEDGTTLNYEISDEQLPYSFPGGVSYGTNYIEVIEHRGYSAPSVITNLVGKFS